MTMPAHLHQIVDAHGNLPAIADGTIKLDGPIRCTDCDMTPNGLLANLRALGHDVVAVEDQVLIRIAD